MTAETTMAGKPRGGFAKWRRDAIINGGKALRNTFNDWISAGSDVPTTEYISNDHFPWVDDLEAGYPTILAETQELLKHRAQIPGLLSVSPDHEGIAFGDEWKSFFLWGYGYRIDDNCAQCPETTRLVEQIPGLITAFFSILTPRTTIPHHIGVSRAILHAHLPIIVPENREEAFLDVNGKKHNWEPGKVVVFDDTFSHGASNNSDIERTVLFLQVRRPVHGMSKVAANAFLKGVQWSPFVQDARRNVTKWKVG